MTDIILQAYRVVDELIQDPDIKMLKQLNQQIEHQYKHEIALFNEAKAVYNDVMNTGGHYHPDFKAASKKLAETKSTLYQKAEVAQYLALEKKVEMKLNELLKDMTDRISSFIPTPDALGIVKKGGHCHVG